MELWTLVRSKIHWSDVVEVDIRCERGQFETLRKVAFSEALEFPVVALWTFEVESDRARLSFFFAWKSISASWASALEDVGGVAIFFVMCS